MKVMELFVPIVRLTVPADTNLDVGGGVRLRPISEEERRIWLKRVGGSFHVHWDVHMASCALTLRRAPANVDLIQDSGRDIVSSFTTALRLLAGGTPGYRYTYFDIENSPGGSWMFHPLSDITRIGEAAAISAEEADDVVEMSGLLRTPPILGNANLQLALRRFNYAYTREIIGDRILDLVIALESLLSPDGPGEIGYKVATRGVRLLRARGSQAHFDALRALYGLRSDIVHRGLHEKLHDSKAMKRLGVALGATPGLIGGGLVEDTLERAHRLVAEIITAYLRHRSVADAEAVVAALDQQE